MKAKVALVTGSTRGIGREIALRLAEQGYSLIINGLKNEDLLFTLKHEIESLGCDCLSFLGDVGDYDITEKMFQLIQKRFGALDVLINNAGISHIGLFSDMTKMEWNRLLQTNLSSVYHCCHFAIPGMVANKSGKIINISSIWGCVGASCEVAYSASKGAMNALTMALAKELAPSNIQVNAVACGVIHTSMNQFLSPSETNELLEEIPCGRMGTPAEVADFVLDICERHPYLTGQVIRFDGGFA